MISNAGKIHTAETARASPDDHEHTSSDPEPAGGDGLDRALLIVALQQRKRQVSMIDTFTNQSII